MKFPRCWCSLGSILAGFGAYFNEKIGAMGNRGFFREKKTPNSPPYYFGKSL